MTFGYLYFKLVAEFPLRMLKSEKDLDEAIKMANKLINRKRDLYREEYDYLRLLGELIRSYEEPLPNLEPAETIRYLLEENNLTESQLSQETGIPESTISGILAGKKGISIRVKKQLAYRFKL